MSTSILRILAGSVIGLISFPFPVWLIAVGLVGETSTTLSISIALLLSAVYGGLTALVLSSIGGNE